MGKRCGCAGTCNCVFKAGRGVALSGKGSKAVPIVIDIDGAQAFIRGGSTDTVNVAITGAGTSNDPYVVAMTRYTGQLSPLLYRFFTPGTYTWTKPGFGTEALITLAGAGGGGAGASATSNANFSQWGRGGQHGQEVKIDQLLANLPTTTTIVIGSGGSGGPATGSTSAAFAGGNGTASSFGAMVASGGAGGQPAARGVADSRVAAAYGQGGSGGMAEASPYSTHWSTGLDGAGPSGEPANGGIGAAPTIRVAGDPGGPAKGIRKAIGTGGGGGVGYKIGTGVPGGGSGGDGGPAAGGGGGGTGQSYSGPGGRGGDGAVVILIQ